MSLRVRLAHWGYHQIWRRYKITYCPVHRHVLCLRLLTLSVFCYCWRPINPLSCQFGWWWHHDGSQLLDWLGEYVAGYRWQPHCPSSLAAGCYLKCCGHLNDWFWHWFAKLTADCRWQVWFYHCLPNYLPRLDTAIEWCQLSDLFYWHWLDNYRLGLDWALGYWHWLALVHCWVACRLPAEKSPALCHWDC